MHKYFFILICIITAQNSYAQIDTTYLGLLENKINNRVLIEGGDTFRIGIDLDFVAVSTPYLITQIGDADTDDYWSPIPDSLWITPENSVLDLYVYPRQDNIEEGEECIIYKIENEENNHLQLIKFHIYDEFPEHTLQIKSGNDDSETMCANDYDATINIFPEIETDENVNDVNFNFNENVTLFTENTTENIYIDISGVEECFSFDEIFKKVCFSMNYPFLNPNTENLKVTLKSPDDKSIVLYDGEVSTHAMNQSCFDMVSEESIVDGDAGYHGDFQPTGDWAGISGAQVNGIWTVVFESNTTEIQGISSYVRMYFDTHKRRRFSYSCDWYALPSNNTEFVYPGGGTLEAGEFNVEVKALNASYDLSTEVYDKSIGYLDTMICSNTSINIDFHELEHPIDTLSFFISNTSSNNCDSIFRIYGTYQPIDVSLDYQILEPGETILFDGQTFSESGIYSVIYQNEHGCDSILHTAAIPGETLARIHTIPDVVSGTSEGCESGVCIPFLSNSYGSFDYYVDGEILENSQINLCEVAPYELYPFALEEEFSSDMEHEVTNLIINGDSQEDFCLYDENQFVHILNYYRPDLDLVWGADGRVYAAVPLVISFSLESLTSDKSHVFNLTADTAEEVTAGVFIPMTEGVHEVKIKHHYSDIEKIVSATLQNHSFPETDTLKLSYLGELDQEASFLLPDLYLCSEITSAAEVCSEVSAEIVDFTLTNQGLLSFKPLTQEPFQICMEICDAQDVCQIALLSVEFEIIDDTTNVDKERIRAIYPNPAQNILYLTEVENYFFKQIRVFDIAGKLIDAIELSETNFYELDVSNYAEGLYLIQIETERGDIYVRKSVIQR